MTLPRTIHRRNARKRAKARPKSVGRPLWMSDELVRSMLQQLTNQIRLSDLINRSYDR